jgi:hypothetical protein
MHEHAIVQLDQAALALVHALDAHSEELQPYLEPAHLETLRAEVVNLRRVLLGLEMGILYENWDVSQEVLEQVTSAEQLPVEQAASRVADALRRDAQS